MAPGCIMDGGEQPDQSASQSGRRRREGGTKGGRAAPGRFFWPGSRDAGRGTVAAADAATLKLDDGAVVVADASIGMDRAGKREDEGERLERGREDERMRGRGREGERVAHKRSDLERSCWRRGSGERDGSRSTSKKVCSFSGWGSDSEKKEGRKEGRKKCKSCLCVCPTRPRLRPSTRLSSSPCTRRTFVYSAIRTTVRLRVVTCLVLILN